MKKLLTLATVLLFSSSASAVSFSWTSGNTTALRVQFGSGTYVSGKAYLVDLNNGWDITSYTVNNSVLDDADIGTNGRFSKTYVASIQDGAAAPGDTFGVYVTYKDSDNVMWYNVLSYTYTIPSTADDTTTISAQTFGTDANYAVTGKGKPLTSGGGWVAVPEPSTAALALAGLALLLKRRKA